ncbi:PadR family transcriptional regulator [Anthocerotibacter panamensis]|uniref:PadR family transcriptional regulator n=1 Tax=Anthocerotibacter panamensis TaxID=2857077 RepID=UPI001C404C7B|nr:PadR family transcriptional regulator [Anthocerotibacter panamensis]
MKDQPESFTLSALEENLLTVLSGRELYGLQILKAFEEATSGRRQIGFGSLYPTLHRLQKKGFVTSRWGDETPEERGGARRRYYQLTGLGETALHEVQLIRVALAAWEPAGG